ncbi:hypothetical protein LJR296_008153 [Cupriavidus necator]|uniref:secretion/conjugation apparatus DotM-related subunit n=1 Tax=Cupriavidus necator TaxID=106590 RepID=UPI003ECE34F7
MSDQIKNDRSVAPLFGVFILVFVMLGWFLWTFRHEAMAQRLLIWKGYEIYPWAVLFDFAKERQWQLVTYFKYARVVTFKEIWVAGSAVGYLWAFLPVSLGIWFSIKALRNPILKAKNVYTIQSLLEAQSQNFSAVAPILHRDLTQEDQPEWASSVHPEEWVAEHGLIYSDRLDEDRAREMLVQQLGQPIADRGQLAKLLPTERALFAVLGLRVFFKDIAACRELMDALNYSASNEGSRPDFSLSTAAFQRCMKCKELDAWVKKHRYPRTLLMAMLIQARELGTLPSSEFIWLKPHDRALWYPLNTAGRKAPMMESAGVFNHMQAEEVAWESGCVLLEPHVDNALAGLRKYLEETGIIEQSNQQQEFSLLNRP